MAEICEVMLFNKKTDITKLPACVSKLEKLIEDYPNFRCHVNVVRTDASLIEQKIITRKDLDERMINVREIENDTDADK